MYRVFSVLLFPLMPAFVLANRVYYLQQAYVVERELQTMEWGVAHTNCQTDEESQVFLCLLRVLKLVWTASVCLYLNSIKIQLLLGI